MQEIIEQRLHLWEVATNHLTLEQQPNDSPFGTINSLVIRYPGEQIDKTVELLFNMNSQAYRPIVSSIGGNLWSIQHFRDKLEFYKNVLVSLSNTTNPLFLSMMMFGDPLKIDEKTYVKLGPIGFAQQLNLVHKFQQLAKLFPEMQRANPDIYLWGEFPSMPNLLSKIVERSRFIPANFETTTELLKQSGVKVDNIWQEKGITTYSTNKRYSQRVYIKTS